MPSCCAINCHYKHKSKKNGKTIHRFPFSRPDVLAKWINNVRREGWYPIKSTVICSDHFERSCYEYPSTLSGLKKDAVPTLFNYPPHLIKKSTPRQERINPTNSSPDIKIQRLAEDQLSKLKAENETIKKRLRAKRQQVRRLKQKMHSLNEIVDHMRKNEMINGNAALVLKKNFSGVPLDIVQRMLKNNNGKITKGTYPPALRSFAITLQSHSTQAYEYVRSVFKFALPHPSVLREWHASVEKEPDSSKESSQNLKTSSEARDQKDKMAEEENKTGEDNNPPAASNALHTDNNPLATSNALHADNNPPAASNALHADVFENTPS